MADTNQILTQLDALISKRNRCHNDSPSQETLAVVTAMCDGISRFAPPDSYYVEVMQKTLNKYGPAHSFTVPHIAGVLVALRDAYSEGYLQNVTQLIHANLFSDFIEMGDYLLSEGYKDPAAVIVGSVLEEHLRQLCTKHGIDILVPTTGKPKKADALNNELAANSVYSKLDQKSVTSWLDLRNKAAHGHYADYTKEQVALLVQSVRDFMVRVPS